jgi:preprotein translocase subunit SecD
MKNFIYLIIAVIVSITLTSAVVKTAGSTKNITLQATEKNSDPAALNQSADIIKARLKLFGIISPEVNISSGNGQLKVQLPESTNLIDIEALLTLKGDLAFYETYSHDELAVLLKNDKQLFTLLDESQLKNSFDPRVGCSAGENRKKADAYLLKMNNVKNCRLVWGAETKKSGNCLFALKTDEAGKSLLKRSDIESVKIAPTSDNQGFKIQIKLNATAAKVFAEATKSNLHKAIAIVIDNTVYSWPVVQNVIEGGEVEVTGDFNESEAKYFPVIFNTAEMPLSFKILK